MSDPILHPKIGNSRDQELLKRADYGVYTHTPQGDLAAYCYRPNPLVDKNPGPKPVVIFFHGGKFDQRLVAQFAPHALHFANRGIVAFIVEYRVQSIEGTSPMEAMEDARTFLKYLTEHHTYFSADLNNIIVGGGASGGFLALHLCSRHKNNLPYMENLPTPKAAILYSPLSNTTKKGLFMDLFPDEMLAKKMSPSEQLDKNATPLIIFHGKADETIPFSMSQKLVKGWSKKKNRVEFIEFETARHIDFNLNVNPQYYEITIKAADAFLVELGILEHDPDVFID